MKFEIDRASSLGDSNIQPCHEAIKINSTYIDVRCVDSINKLHPDVAEAFRSKGTNHRVENGRIARDIKDTCWMIEIKNLNELLALYRKYGDLIIQESDQKEFNYKIMIYDQDY